jgi:UDP-N-acetylmuramoyl-L-alanyl-D-glutamate--2,6-diaminopimelate ligase
VDSIVTPPPRPHHPRPVRFHDLCEGLGLSVKNPGDVSITGVSINASQVVPGDVFVALVGSHHHGAEFAHDAVAQGARAIITDAHGAQMLAGMVAPVAVHDNPRHVLGLISRDVYRTGEAAPSVLAVTGTNGKTSVTFFLEGICRALGQKTALSNSTERRVAGEVFRTKLTTPESNELHAMLARAREKGVTTLCLEASAQAIERSRLNGLRIAVAGFTNLSHDHFEDYGDMDRYLATKAQLFDPQYSARAVICLDTEWGETLAGQVQIPVTTVASSTAPAASTADWVYEVVGTDGERTDFSVTGDVGTIRSRIHAVGAHMVQNAAVAIVMVIDSGQEVSDLADVLSPDKGGIDVVIPGRLEKVSGEAPVAIYVDAGRSADAYEKTLTTLATLASGKLIAVCGTSGNRDPSKRPIMGAVAASVADHVIITDDDPRWEDPSEIRQGLLAGARGAGAASTIEEIPDPVDAIVHAVSVAKPGDVIVWSGPGSQNYREVRGERHPFSAREQARLALHQHGMETGS